MGRRIQVVQFKFISDEKGELKTIEGFTILSGFFNEAQYRKILERVFVVRPPAFSAAGHTVLVAVIDGGNTLIMKCSAPYRITEEAKNEIVEKMRDVDIGIVARIKEIKNLSLDLDLLFDLGLRQDQRNMFTPEEGHELCEVVAERREQRYLAEVAANAPQLSDTTSGESLSIPSDFYPVDEPGMRQFGWRDWFKKILKRVWDAEVPRDY